LLQEDALSYSDWIYQGNDGDMSSADIETYGE
jgi:hypothetical protein